MERAEARDSKGSGDNAGKLLRGSPLLRGRVLRRVDGTFRRSHVQKVVQRPEVGANQIIVRGSAPRLLETLLASGGRCGVETARIGVRSFVPKWLPEQDSNLRPFD